MYLAVGEKTLLILLIPGLSVPFPLRYLFATNPKVMSRVLTIVHRVITTFLIKSTGMTVKSGARSGA
jgi:hypothetical protein